MKRVFLLNYSPELSGAERSALALASHLEARRFRIVVGAPAWGPFLTEAEGLGVDVVETPIVPAGASRPLALLRNAFLLRRLLAERRIDLVHANSFHLAKSLAPLVLLGSCSFVVSIRDIVPMSRATSRALSLARAVMAVSEATAEHVRSGLPEAARRKVCCVYNGVDLPAFEVAASIVPEAVIPCSPGSVRIGMLAPLVAWKGQELLIRAGAKAAAMTRRRLEFFFAGGTQFSDVGYLEKLRALSQESGLGGDVHFLGQRSDIAEILGALDVVVCASTRPDPLPRAVLEAMAAGRAVIGPDEGGVPEQIEHGSSGWLFPARDEDALASAIARAVDEPKWRLELGRRARERAGRLFSIDKHVQRVQSVYDEALS